MIVLKSSAAALLAVACVDALRAPRQTKWASREVHSNKDYRLKPRDHDRCAMKSSSRSSYSSSSSYSSCSSSSSSSEQCCHKANPWHGKSGKQRHDICDFDNFFTVPHVSHEHAAKACEEHGGVLAQLSNRNFIEAVTAAYKCSGPQSQSWIESWDDNCYNDARLVLSTGPTCGGGTINVPDRDCKLRNALCMKRCDHRHRPCHVKKFDCCPASHSSSSSDSSSSSSSKSCSSSSSSSSSCCCHSSSSSSCSSSSSSKCSSSSSSSKCPSSSSSSKCSSSSSSSSSSCSSSSHDHHRCDCNCDCYDTFFSYNTSRLPSIGAGQDFFFYSNGLLPPYIADDGDLSIVNGSLVVNSSVFTKWSPVIVDNVKFLLFANRSVVLPPCGEVAVVANMSVDVNVVTNANYSAQILNYNTDPRPAVGFLTATDFQDGVSFSFVVTNNKVYAWYERRVDRRAPGHFYAAFSFGFPVANITTGSFHKYSINFNSDERSVRWIMDGEEVYKIYNVGTEQSHQYMLSDWGGVEERFWMGSIIGGFGTGSFMSGYAPCSSTVATPDGGQACVYPVNDLGLANLFTGSLSFNPRSIPQTPATYVVNAPAQNDLIWGQGAVLTLSDFELGLCRKPACANGTLPCVVINPFFYPTPIIA